MRSNRIPLRPGWVPALLLCVGIAVGLATTSDAPRTSPWPSASSGQSVAEPGVPMLACRADSAPALPHAATPTSADGTARASDAANLSDEANAGHAAPADAASAADDDQAHMRRGLPLTASHPDVAPVIAVQKRYTGELLKHPLVVGTATGMNDRGEISVVVLAKAEITDLPGHLGGVPVVVYVTGELFASKGKPPGTGGGGSEPAVDPTARFARPVPIGVSTGHPSITAGTIGCRVTDGTFVYALSNNHVYADENQASLGDAVIQPGTYDDGSSPSDDIGTLADYEDIDFTAAPGGANVMDAAISVSSTALLGNATPADGYGQPVASTLAPAINLRVLKYGRTTGQTNGKIFAINATVNVGYSTGVAGYVGQIVITPGSYSAGGDSGSLIVAQKGADARKAVGLLFAGSSSSTIASPIGPILTRFSVTIDGE